MSVSGWATAPHTRQQGGWAGAGAGRRERRLRHRPEEAARSQTDQGTGARRWGPRLSVGREYTEGPWVPLCREEQGRWRPAGPGSGPGLSRFLDGPQARLSTLQASVSPSGSGDRDYRLGGVLETQGTMVMREGAQSLPSLLLLAPSTPVALGLLPPRAAPLPAPPLPSPLPSFLAPPFFCKYRCSLHQRRLPPHPPCPIPAPESAEDQFRTFSCALGTASCSLL